MSSESRFEAGAPILGGIPVCWPWFGAHPGGEAGMPFHGFARLEEWNVIGAGETAGGATRMELGLGESPRTTALWPHPFDLRREVVVGADLRVALAMRNTGRVPFTCTCALHSYFAVGDIAAVRVLGLEGCRYADTVPVPEREAVQECPVLIEAETDRVYEDTEAATVIEDASLRRRIRVAKEGSRTTVVWNPWIAKSSRMPDFGDTEYRGMLCVETANARADARTIPPGGAHRLAATISVGPTA
jgi:glucose-6-phosphate 1-epimerase